MWMQLTKRRAELRRKRRLVDERVGEAEARRRELALARKVVQEAETRMAELRLLLEPVDSRARALACQLVGKHYEVQESRARLREALKRVLQKIDDYFPRCVTHFGDQFSIEKITTVSFGQGLTESQEEQYVATPKDQNSGRLLQNILIYSSILKGIARAMCARLPFDVLPDEWRADGDLRRLIRDLALNAWWLACWVDRCLDSEPARAEFDKNPFKEGGTIVDLRHLLCAGVERGEKKGADFCVEAPCEPLTPQPAPRSLIEDYFA